jgi:hypothetical protein
MSQDRRRPQQAEATLEPKLEIEQELLRDRRVRLVIQEEVKRAKKDSDRLAAEVMQLLRNHGLDCSDALDALEDEMPRTLH